MNPQIYIMIGLAAFAGYGLGCSLFQNNITRSARLFSVGACAFVIVCCLIAAYGLSNG